MGAYKTAVIADSPYWYYVGDEASGTSLTDSSGNNRTGTINGSGQSYGQQRLSQDTVRSINWNGAANMLSPSSLLLASADMTLEGVFVAPDLSTAGNRGIFGTTTTSYARLTTTAGLVTNCVFRFKSNTYTSAATFSTGVLYHIAITYSVSTGVFTLYVNGNSETFTETAGSWVGSTYMRFMYDTVYFMASIGGHFAYYRSALSSTRVNAHYAALLNDTTSSVASTYSFGAAPTIDTSGTTALNATFSPGPDMSATVRSLSTQVATMQVDPSASALPMLGITAAASFDVVETGGYIPQVVSAAFKPDVAINPTRLKVTLPPTQPPVVINPPDGYPTVTVDPSKRKPPIIRTIRETYPTPTLVDGKPQ